MKTHRCTHVHADVGAGWRNISRGIKVYVWVETVGLFLLRFYRVPVALGKSQGRACIPLILRCSLQAGKPLWACVCALRHVTFKGAEPLRKLLAVKQREFAFIAQCVSSLHTHVIYVCVCVYLHLTAGWHLDVETQWVVRFYQVQAAVFSALTSCHKLLWLCCLINFLLLLFLLVFLSRVAVCFINSCVSCVSQHQETPVSDTDSNLPKSSIIGLLFSILAVNEPPKD